MPLFGFTVNNSLEEVSAILKRSPGGVFIKNLLPSYNISALLSPWSLVNLSDELEPKISNFAPGLVVPIPILPVFSDIKNRFLLFVRYSFSPPFAVILLDNCTCVSLLIAVTVYVSSPSISKLSPTESSVKKLDPLAVNKLLDTVLTVPEIKVSFVATCNFPPGFAVPIPTLPPESMRILSERVLEAIVSNIIAGVSAPSEQLILPPVSPSLVKRKFTLVPAEFICNSSLGFVVPIPALPPESMRIRSLLLVLMAMWLSLWS